MPMLAMEGEEKRMKTLVAYSSCYGYTKKYAEWIREELHGDLMDIKQVSAKTLEKYDRIIIGGGMYAGKVSSASFVKKEKSILLQKELVLFVVGLLDAELAVNQPSIRQSDLANFGQDILDHGSVYHFQGGMDYKKLSFMHRTMMGMMSRITKSKPESSWTESDKAIVSIKKKAVDFSRKKAILPLLECCRNSQV